MDSRTEAGILRSMRDLAAGRTSVQVAHRLSTVKHCDSIVVLEGGRVAEQGSHAELLHVPGGIYAAMWRLQQAEQSLQSILPAEGGAVAGEKAAAPGAKKADAGAAASDEMGEEASEDAVEGALANAAGPGAVPPETQSL